MTMTETGWRSVVLGTMSEQMPFDRAYRELADLDRQYKRRKASAAAIGIPFDGLQFWVTAYRRRRGRPTWLDPLLSAESDLT